MGTWVIYMKFWNKNVYNYVLKIYICWKLKNSDFLSMFNWNWRLYPNSVFSTSMLNRKFSHYIWLDNYILKISFKWQYWSYTLQQQVILGKVQGSTQQMNFKYCKLLTRMENIFQHFVWDDWIIIWLYNSTVNISVPHCRMWTRGITDNTIHVQVIFWIVKIWLSSLKSILYIGWPFLQTLTKDLKWLTHKQSEKKY